MHSSLKSLLQLPDAAIEAFERQLFAINSENKQRALIRALVAQAGNQEVKKLLTAVAKLQAGTTPASAAALESIRPMKQVRQKTAEEDTALGGQIFNLIFNS